MTSEENLIILYQMGKTTHKMEN